MSDVNQYGYRIQRHALKLARDRVRSDGERVARETDNGSVEAGIFLEAYALGVSQSVDVINLLLEVNADLAAGLE